MKSRQVWIEQFVWKTCGETCLCCWSLLWFFHVGDSCGLWDWSKSPQTQIMTSHGVQKKMRQRAWSCYETKEDRWVCTLCMGGNLFLLLWQPWLIGQTQTDEVWFIVCEVPRNSKNSGNKHLAKKLKNRFFFWKLLTWKCGSACKFKIEHTLLLWFNAD